MLTTNEALNILVWNFVIIPCLLYLAAEWIDIFKTATRPLPKPKPPRPPAQMEEKRAKAWCYGCTATTDQKLVRWDSNRPFQATCTRCEMDPLTCFEP